MTLREYFDQFQSSLPGEPKLSTNPQIAAEVAAAHHIGLSFEQLRQFLARRTEITSVAVALKGNGLAIESIERILQARSNGAIYPKDILAQAFSPDEILEQFQNRKHEP